MRALNQSVSSLTIYGSILTNKKGIRSISGKGSDWDDPAAWFYAQLNKEAFLSASETLAAQLFSLFDSYPEHRPWLMWTNILLILLFSFLCFRILSILIGSSALSFWWYRLRLGSGCVYRYLFILGDLKRKFPCFWSSGWIPRMLFLLLLL